MRHIIHQTPKLWLLVSLSLSVCAAPRCVWAQELGGGKEYGAIEITEPWALKTTERNRKLSLVREVMSGNANLSANEKEFKEYWTLYYFRRMTQYKPVARMTVDPLGDLRKLRRDLVQNIRKSGNAQVHNYMNQMCLKYMSEIATSENQEFHPAVRYTAIAVVGDLNRKEAVLSGDSAAADPMPEALPVLLEEFSRPDQVDAVRVGALVGILRHVHLDQYRPEDRRLGEADRQKILATMMSLAKATELPVGRSEQSHIWLRRRAFEVLGYLDSTDANQELVKLLEGLVSDDDSPLALRCTASATLGHLSLPAEYAEDPTAKAAKLGFLAIDACKAEVLRLRELSDEEQQNVGRGGPGFIGGIGSRPRKPKKKRSRSRRRQTENENILNPGGLEEEYEEPEQDPRLALSRRVLKTRLNAVRVGLKGIDGKGGIEGLATEMPHKKHVTDVTKALDRVMDVCDDSDSGATKVLRQVADAGTALSRILRALPKGNVVDAPEDGGADLPDVDVPEEPAEANDPAEAQ